MSPDANPRMPMLLKVILVTFALVAIYFFLTLQLMAGTLSVFGVVALLFRSEYGRAALWIVSLGLLVFGLIRAMAAYSVSDIVPLDTRTFVAGWVQVAVAVFTMIALMRDDVSAWMARPRAGAKR